VTDLPTSNPQDFLVLILGYCCTGLKKEYLDDWIDPGKG
jgi:hypothetical protein